MEEKYLTKDEAIRQIEEVVGGKPVNKTTNKLDEVLQRIKSRGIGGR